MFRDGKADLQLNKTPENPNWSPSGALLGNQMLDGLHLYPQSHCLKNLVPDVFVQYTSDKAILKMSLFPMSKAYNHLSIA